jgi:hypothetical protein
MREKRKIKKTSRRKKLKKRQKGQSVSKNGEIKR